MNKFETELLKKKIDEADVVSFDIFDTLLFRLVRKPSDIFEIVNILHNSNVSKEERVYNFRSIRIRAEEEARKESDGLEVTLEEIYKNITGYSERIKNRLREEELSCEKKLTYPNLEIAFFFRYSLRHAKKVIITSDIYLDKEFLADILEQNGISKYYKLYASSEHKYTKQSGSLFKKIIDEEGVKPQKLLHIGNDIRSDVIRPASLGIKTFLYRSSHCDNNDLKAEDFIFLNLSNCYALNDNYRKFQREYRSAVYQNAYIFGYKIFGILMLGYIKWLNKRFIQNNIKQAFFFSREGYFIKKVYDFYFENDTNNKINTEYLYVSRKALYLPALTDGLLIDDFQLFYPVKGKTIKDYLHSLGVSETDAKNFIKVHGLKNNDSAAELDQCIRELKTLINNSNKPRLDNTEAYLSQFDYSKKFAIVDVGWSGGMQIAFECILSDLSKKTGTTYQIPCLGYFLGQDQDMQKFMERGGKKNPYNLNNEGWLFNYNDLNERQKILFSGNEIFELIFDPNEGTTIGYEKCDDEQYTPITKTVEFNESYKIIEFIQQGALDYISDSRSVDFSCLSPSTDAAFANFSRFLRNPEKEYVDMFGDITAYDSETAGEVKLAEKVSCKNMKVFADRFSKSYWKVGYLKRNLPDMHIDYAKLYYYIRKLYTRS